MKRWDIFCKIVDNFGDIGVCWRLARQLRTEHSLQVRLWIDDLATAKQMIPDLNVNLNAQTVENIHIQTWHADTVFDHCADVMIEGFSCGLPATYQANMRTDCVWINLEYLSAEPWVETFHKGSAKHGKHTRHFFFPGFTAETGGLLRERDIIKNNQALAESKGLQTQFLQRLGLENSSRLNISLFCYPYAPIESLLEIMADTDQPITCYVPISSILPKIASYFDHDMIAIGDVLIYKNLHLHVLPFLTQPDYDQLLATCDINFVRGEDSWIRAIWAGKPFIWQPYWQTENTHIIKLNAFLDLFYSGSPKNAQQAIRDIHTRWVSESVSMATWKNFLNNIPILNEVISEQTKALATQTDLATKLVIFSENILKNIVKNKV